MALRPTSATDTSRVPIPQARVDFYLQGATVTGSSVSISTGSTGTVTVSGVGDFAVGDSVRVGLDGALLTVTTVVSTTQLTLSNSSGFTVVLDSGNRLVNLSRRPTVYQDQLGAVALTTPILTDSGGRATVYLPPGFYDYIVSGDIIALDANSQTTIASATATMSWNHTASGDNRFVVVGISWQEGTASETLDSVTYDGIPMTRLNSSSAVDLFALVNPPSGTKSIPATWSGSNAKAAIGGAESFNNVDANTPYSALLRSASGSNASPTTTFTRNQPNTLFMDCLGVDTVPASTSATVGGGQTALWNTVAGTVPAATRTLGASSYAKKTTDSVTMSWALSQSNSWGLIVVELFPSGIRLFTDEDGVSCACEPFALNAADFASLQEAVDALPDSGGTLLIPAGTYTLTSSLQINKTSVTIIGAGQSTRIVPADPVHNPIDLITVSAGLLRMSNLLLDGLAEEQDLEEGTACLAFVGLGVSGRLVLHCFLENVVAQHASQCGFRLVDTITFTAINCEAIFNQGDGVRIKGSDTEEGTSALVHFTNCALSQNGGMGANVGDVDTGTISIHFMGCSFENNSGDGYTLADIGVAVTAVQSMKLSLISCYFELAPVGCAQYVYFNASHGIVDNCFFAGTGEASRAVMFATSFFSRFTNNVAEGFTEEIVRFDTICLSCVEFGNRDLDADIPRIVIDGDATVIGMSRRAIGLPRVGGEGARPSSTEVKAGSLLWVTTPGTGNSNLQIWDGSAWKNIALS